MPSSLQRSAEVPHGPGEGLVRAVEAMAAAGLWSALEAAAGHVSPEVLDVGQQRRVLAALERATEASRSGASAILAARLLRAAEALLDEGLPDVASTVLAVVAARGVTTAQRPRLALLVARRGGEVACG